MKKALIITICAMAFLLSLGEVLRPTDRCDEEGTVEPAMAFADASLVTSGVKPVSLNGAVGHQEDPEREIRLLVCYTYRIALNAEIRHQKMVRDNLYEEADGSTREFLDHLDELAAAQNELYVTAGCAELTDPLLSAPPLEGYLQLHVDAYDMAIQSLLRRAGG